MILLSPGLDRKAGLESLSPGLPCGGSASSFALLFVPKVFELIFDSTDDTDDDESLL